MCDSALTTTSQWITVVCCPSGVLLSHFVVSLRSWRKPLIVNLQHFVLSLDVCRVAWIQLVSASALSYAAMTSDIRFLFHICFYMSRVREISLFVCFCCAFTADVVSVLIVSVSSQSWMSET